MSTPDPVLHNPTTFTIVDPTLSADNVTAFKLLFGQAAGGPYPLSSTDDALTSLTTNTDGSVTGKFVDLNTKLAPGTWFAVAEAKNAAGYSGNSPEARFVIDAPVPNPPSGFSVA